MFLSNSGSPYMEIQNDSGTVIDTLSGLTNDVWYRYTLSYENGTYTRVQFLPAVKMRAKIH